MFTFPVVMFVACVVVIILGYVLINRLKQRTSEQYILFGILLSIIGGILIFNPYVGLVNKMLLIGFIFLIIGLLSGILGFIKTKRKNIHLSVNALVE